MHHLHRQFICQVCPDKRKVQHAIDDAKRISYRLRGMMDSRGRMQHTRNVRRALFHTPTHCSTSGNSCNEFSRYENDLCQAERELDETFIAFQEELQGLEEKEACARKGRAFELLRGFYPEAARLMRR